YALYVDPSRWGGGAGRALVAAAEARLRVLGHAEAALWVLEANQLGRSFYETVGWSADGAQAARCEVDDALEVRYRRTL
ncbi:MAG TPA: GNAT family N-acetyltransferase, partial [Actinomycetes bacterium]|nr:GNAT family N-acetyltransferase [Actinomycetes bacterium]